MNIVENALTVPENPAHEVGVAEMLDRILNLS